MKPAENDAVRLAVSAAFDKHYFDLGVYRLMARNKRLMRRFFIGSFLSAILCAAVGLKLACFVFAAAFMLLAWLGAVDHMLIGRSRNRVMAELRLKKVGIGWDDAIEIYGLK